jgi:hypothetical protein
MRALKEGGTGFCRLVVQDCKQLAGNKILGGECLWEKENVIQSNKFPLQSCKRQKNNQNDRRTANVVVAVAADV